ncbi:hypothetical protein ABTY98_28985 [Streptomyces sp. NPDC096040]|uniref:hypothetical protein n=1 Tax=Streptomyces sp. NPDC096040 TaxID=3155541 RepID=UPI00332A8BDC
MAVLLVPMALGCALTVPPLTIVMRTVGVPGPTDSRPGRPAAASAWPISIGSREP